MMKYKTILNAGSIAGLFSYFMFLAFYYGLSVNPIGPVKFLTLIGVLALLYWAMKQYRDTELEGFAVVSQLLPAAFIFSFIYASLNGMLVYLHGAFVDAGYVQLIVTDSLQSIGEYKDMMVDMVGKDEYKKMIEQYESMDAATVALSDAQSKSMTALLAGVIMAFVLRKKPPIFDNIDE